MDLRYREPTSFSSVFSLCFWIICPIARDFAQTPKPGSVLAGNYAISGGNFGAVWFAGLEVVALVLEDLYLDVLNRSNKDIVFYPCGLTQTGCKGWIGPSPQNYLRYGRTEAVDQRKGYIFLVSGLPRSQLETVLHHVHMIAKSPLRIL